MTTETTGRQEQVTVPDRPRPDVTIEMHPDAVPDSVLIAELERRGFTVTRPGELIWIEDPPTHAIATVDGAVRGSVWDHRAPGFDGQGVFAIVLGTEHDSDHDYGTVDAARAAVERALKGGK